MSAVHESVASTTNTTTALRFTLNGKSVAVNASADQRLSSVLRDQLGLTGTKVGCDAGDCGACTVLLDGHQVCACLVPLGQLDSCEVITVEGLATDPRFSALQRAFHVHGAAQCGICTPGMLLAACDLLAHNTAPSRAQIEDALGGVLCRCTGYRKIVDAVQAVLDNTVELLDDTLNTPSVGTRLLKVDGAGKVDGSDRFGADQVPVDCLALKPIRSPYPRARFTLGDCTPLRQRFPGLVAVLTAADVPVNNFGIYPDLKDQPVFADGETRFRGEALLALVGDVDTLAQISIDDLPLQWQVLEPITSIAAALAPDAHAVHATKPDNILIRGQVVSGDVNGVVDTAAAIAEGSWQTSYVEHAYIEPEAGFAERHGDRLEISASTQTPYMDRDEAAHVLGLNPDQVRILSSCCGGGFGGKLDQSVQPLLAVAAWTLKRPVRCVYSRTESMASTSKRHPASLRARASAGHNGKLLSYDFNGDFNTGAYASWGPTVAGRVPIHAAGPYYVPNVHNQTRGVYTNLTPAGAFRGFGVPQAAIAHETLMDQLAEQLNTDPLQFRLDNALRVGDATATGQVLRHSAGLAACLEQLQPRWRELRAAAEAHNRSPGPQRLGVGVGCMWYGLGNTSMSNPSTMKAVLYRDGRVVLFNGVQDIGQGSNTIMLQIFADALNCALAPAQIDGVINDTDRTFDAGKTSASRQTLVSGKAVQLAGDDLRQHLLRLSNAGPDAELKLVGAELQIREHGQLRTLDLARLPVLDNEPDDAVLVGHGRFDPPTTPLDADGQGEPYASYGFAAQLASLSVDIELGTVQLHRIIAAHDVGKAINPTQVEGQIHGGIAQGIGLALMEEFIPGRTENLHDYLIPTVGDVPDIEIYFIEDPEPLGPFGAKGIGEPALVPTAPAILNAIYHACGARLHHLPALPHRVLEALS